MTMAYSQPACRRPPRLSALCPVGQLERRGQRQQRVPDRVRARIGIGVRPAGGGPGRPRPEGARGEARAGFDHVPGRAETAADGEQPEGDEVDQNVGYEAQGCALPPVAPDHGRGRSAAPGTSARRSGTADCGLGLLIGRPRRLGRRRDAGRRYAGWRRAGRRRLQPGGLAHGIRQLLERIPRLIGHDARLLLRGLRDLRLRQTRVGALELGSRCCSATWLASKPRPGMGGNVAVVLVRHRHVSCARPGPAGCRR